MSAVYPINSTEFEKKLIRMEYEEVLELFSSGEISEKEFYLGTSPTWKSLYFATKENIKIKLGYVYLIENDLGEVKCGRSINAKIRLRSLETQGNLTIKNTFVSEAHSEYFKTETEFHRNFSEFRMKGEWFSVSFNDSVNFINSLMGRTPLRLMMDNKTNIMLT